MGLIEDAAYRGELLAAVLVRPAPAPATDYEIPALALEEVRVPGRAAGGRAVVRVAAAQLVGAERLAAALARHDSAAGLRRRAHLELGGARRRQVVAAGEDGAVAAALVRGHGQAHVEAVHDAHAVRGLVAVAVEGDLRERGGRRAAEAPALEPAAAVAGGAVELLHAGGRAAGARPDAAGPGVVWGREGAVGERREVEAAAFRDLVARVRLDAGPYRVWAVVHDGQGHRGKVREEEAAAREEGGEDEE